MIRNGSCKIIEGEFAMPEYVYRREDGSTFTIRQKFSDDPLKIDPETGQSVVRVVQNAGVIFKGSGFYVNDSKQASKRSLSSTSHENGSEEKSLAKKEDKPKDLTTKEDKPKSLAKKDS